MARPTAAEIVARRLHEAGCRHAFGIPGGEVLTLMEALSGAGIRYVLCRHENAGGFMAEGTWHATGAPGILVATVGPGVANAVNVVANAQQDRVPLIFLTGCIDPADSHTYTHQVFDHAAVLRPVVKASFTLNDGAVPEIIDKAIAIALDDQPGPVHIDIPIAVAGREQEHATVPARSRPARSAPAESADLAAARAALARAERPLVIAGVDVLDHRAAEAVASFCRDLSVPLITTYKAKGILPESEPLALGGAGLSPVADRYLMPLVKASDLIVLAGYDPIEMRVGWRNAWDPAATPVIEISSVANTHYVHQATWSFVCDVGAGLEALRAGVTAHGSWPNDQLARTKRALLAEFRADEDWGPAAVCQEVRRLLPDHGIATCDTGAHRILLSQVWECRFPHSLLQSSGLCTMGAGLPIAIGYKIARPDLPVVAFSGDGCMEMVLGELATLRDSNLAIPIVVFVDASLALIEMKQRGSNLPNLGTDTGITDFAAVARAMGGTGVDVHSRAELAHAFGTALAGEKFTVIAAHIARGAYDGRI